MPIPIDGIAIEKFIFHVVHHGEDQPILMDDTPLGKFDIFFRNRIAEVLNGNQFFFDEASPFLEKILKLKEDEAIFLEVSKELAKDFHTHRDNRVKAGVMILIKARIHAAEKIILIKYDHENVLFYKLKDNKAILEELTNTFSKSRDALQKSIVIDLNTERPFGMVIDKSERQHITQFFKNYLGIKRKYERKDLTGKVRESYFQTIKQFKQDLPKEYTSQLATNFYEAVQNTENFESEPFLKQIVGTHYKPEMLQTFERELKKADILGEVFPLNKEIEKPKQKKYRTREGVAIQISTDATDTVEIVHGEENTKIIITTQQLLEE